MACGWLRRERRGRAAARRLLFVRRWSAQVSARTWCLVLACGWLRRAPAEVTARRERRGRAAARRLLFVRTWAIVVYAGVGTIIAAVAWED